MFLLSPNRLGCGGSLLLSAEVTVFLLLLLGVINFNCPVTTASSVPATRGELEGDEALETLRRTGRRRLLVDSIVRFRAADGFSHSRALAFQVTLTLLPALIAVVGLAAALGQDDFTRIVRDTIQDLTPGAPGEILTEALRHGSERDRPFLWKYLAGLGLALTAGVLALLSLVVLMGGAAIRDTFDWGETLDTVWKIAR